MQFEWDENKRQKLIRTRDVDITDAALIFEGVVFTNVDDRQDYGEERLKSVGMADGECFIVVHTRRGDVTRLITAWKGGQVDRTEYEKRLAERVEKNEGEG